MNLFVFGLGYSARHFVAQYGAAFERISATVRDKEGRRPSVAGIEMLHLSPEGASPEIEDRLGMADVIVVSIPPGTSADPVLARFGRKIAGIKRPQRIIYL